MKIPAMFGLDCGFIMPGSERSINPEEKKVILGKKNPRFKKLVIRNFVDFNVIVNCEQNSKIAFSARNSNELQLLEIKTGNSLNIKATSEIKSLSYYDNQLIYSTTDSKINFLRFNPMDFKDIKCEGVPSIDNLFLKKGLLYFSSYNKLYSQNLELRNFDLLAETKHSICKIYATDERLIVAERDNNTIKLSICDLTNSIMLKQFSYKYYSLSDDESVFYCDDSVLVPAENIHTISAIDLKTLEVNKFDTGDIEVQTVCLAFNSIAIVNTKNQMDFFDINTHDHLMTTQNHIYRFLSFSNETGCLYGSSGMGEISMIDFTKAPNVHYLY